MSALAAEPWASALGTIERILGGEPEPDDVLRHVVATVYEQVEHYTWVGLYFVDEGELILGPWAGVAGLPEHTHLPLDEGPIGRAVAGAQTVVVADVSAEPGYAACFPWTRSEIDVPVLYRGVTVGVIGIDSDRPRCFVSADRAFLERVAECISAHCLVGWDTGGIDWAALE